MGQRNCHPQPGDLIAINRPGYQHWALYVGDGYVIHVTGVNSGSVEGRSSSKFVRAQVKKQLLKDVAGKNKWRVNNKYDCLCPPFSVRKIIQCAECWVDMEVPYNVLSRNCEHFVTLLRYGVALSDQATVAGDITGNAKITLAFLAVAGIGAAVGSFLPGVTVAAAAAIAVSRIFSDAVPRR
ncbi:phospholipase A and acyltransferase 3-like [Sylvia atricapilla]|uniref:phospholipase A and acyltransferase 3-like n=1 Tax=Sylvia atricapilla TaxID=48155 RepID=UPI003392734F